MLQSYQNPVEKILSGICIFDYKHDSFNILKGALPIRKLIKDKSVEEQISKST